MKMCDIVAVILKNKQTREITENATIENGSDLTLALSDLTLVPLIAAKSRWVRQPKS
jgi:hypothetical protein